MKQYLNLCNEVLQNGTKKESGRKNMPGTTSYFGPQIRIDLNKGFPLLTTKKMFWKGVVVELLWFLRGDTNIKFLVENGVNIWNEDAYNYYCKKCKELRLNPTSYEKWLETCKNGAWDHKIYSKSDYTLGDCGFQYGRVWRNWFTGKSKDFHLYKDGVSEKITHHFNLDQIANVLTTLRFNPMSRRHVVTAIDPSNDNNLALYWCHAMFQFNCRPIQYRNTSRELIEYDLKPSEVESFVKNSNLPKYYLDCKLYQRSADLFLGVPFNIASYALLTTIFAKMSNMLPGTFIHSFGDCHIYDNHKDQINEQVKRDPYKLPEINFSNEFNLMCRNLNRIDDKEYYAEVISDVLSKFEISDFKLVNYKHHNIIKGKLSTGLN